MGDEEAFSLLFEKYHSTLVLYGRTLLKEADIINDCIQDVYADIWIYRYKLSEVSSVKAYLISCVRKRFARLIEREPIFFRTKNIDSLEFSFDFSIEDRLIKDEATAIKVSLLNRFINSLPSRQKEALYLRYHQELSILQIADVLNVNSQSAKNLLHRAIIQLRKEFSSHTFMLFLGILYK